MLTIALAQADDRDKLLEIAKNKILSTPTLENLPFPPKEVSNCVKAMQISTSTNAAKDGRIFDIFPETAKKTNTMFDN